MVQGFGYHLCFFAQGATEEVQREAVWALANITAGGTPQQVINNIHMFCVQCMMFWLYAGVPSLTNWSNEAIM